MTYNIDDFVSCLDGWVDEQITKSNSGTLLSWDDSLKTICINKHIDGSIPSHGDYIDFLAPNNKTRYGLAHVSNISYNHDGLWIIHIQSPIRVLVPSVAIGDIVRMYSFSEKFKRFSQNLRTIIARSTNKDMIG
jgi:hypothetical protein